MTSKDAKSIILVFVVISILLAVQFLHLLKPEMGDVSSDFDQSKIVEADIHTEITDTLFGKDQLDYSFPEITPGHFTENQGQWGDHISFLGQTSFGHAGFGDHGVFYYLSDEDGGYMIKVNFQDAGKVSPFGREDAGFSSNYFHGNDPGKWVREARSFEEIVYEDVWPGIDILYYFNNGTLKYDIIVGEYADAGSISFFVEGHGSLEIEENNLEIFISEDVSITDSELTAFYEDGIPEKIEFEKLGDSTYGFQVDKKDGKTLIIDPIVFATSTFLGGSGRDSAKDMKIDGDGNIIILGETYSADFPNTTGAYQNESAGTQDLSITKMDPNATYLIFSTYIGGWHMDFPSALDVDDAGDIYATGETWAADFPTTNGSFCEDDPAGSYSVFVVKLSSSGSDLIYSTYVGSTVADWARDIEVSNGYAHVVGHTYSYDFPFVEHPIDNAHGTAFLFILNQDGSNLTHTDFWGGHENEWAHSLEIAANGDVVVGGVANSKDFPITSGAYQEIAEDNSNGFLLRFRPSTHTLIFSTFIGGTEYDEIDSIYLDRNGDIYFAGFTRNPGTALGRFPTTTGAYDRQGNGSKDVFIGKMSNDGSALLYSTFIGGEGEETVGSIDVDSQGNVYFTGSIDSGVNFTVAPDAFDYTFNNDSDVLFAVLNSDGSDVLYSTYLGGIASDSGETCIIASSDEILLLGTTYSTNFPSTSKAFQTQNNGTGDLFITKFVIGNYIFLHEGWNLVSVPLVPPDLNLKAVLSSISGSYDAVQWYDSFTGSWKHTHISKPSHLNTLDTIEHHMGFWVHITEHGGVLLEYRGNPPGATGASPLHTGWNEVGYPASGNYQRDMALNSLTFGVEVNSIWYFDGGNQTWREMGPSDYFVKGRGYWIHATQDCTWMVP